MGCFVTSTPANIFAVSEIPGRRSLYNNTQTNKKILKIEKNIEEKKQKEKKVRTTIKSDVPKNFGIQMSQIEKNVILFGTTTASLTYFECHRA
jgi:hypothetical protein